MRFEICFSFIFHTAFQLFWIWVSAIWFYKYMWREVTEGEFVKTAIFLMLDSIHNIVMGFKSSCGEVLEDLMKRAEFW